MRFYRIYLWRVFSRTSLAMVLGAFSGAGTVSGGTFAGTTRISLSEAADDWSIDDVPTFDGCAFSGEVKVDFGRTAENPLSEAKPTNLLVAKFANGAPDVSAWRLVGTGRQQLKGKFTATPSGEVRMAVFVGGSVVIVK